VPATYLFAVRESVERRALCTGGKGRDNTHRPDFSPGGRVSELHLTTRFAIHDGEVGEFKSLAGHCMEVVREQDSGTLQYDWFLNADGTECVLRERYRDSDAVLEHTVNLGDLMGRFMSISDPDIEIYGAPTDALLEAIAALQPRVYSAYQSL
jgi:hypothetical protein